MRCWENIAEDLSKAAWSGGWVTAVTREGREIWIVDADRDDGQGFIARLDDKLTAFLELERAVCTHLLSGQGKAD